MMITRRSFFAGPLVLASAAIHPTVADEPGQDDFVPRMVPFDFNATEIHLTRSGITWIDLPGYPKDVDA